MLSAKVAPVSFGLIEFDALLSSEADRQGKPRFFIAASQVAALFQLNKAVASRDLKALLGEDSQLNKCKSDLHPKAVNVLTFSQFEIVARKLDKKGNPVAIELVDVCLSLSLYQRACDAFGLQFEKDDRDKWLLDRAAGKIARNSLTDAIKIYLDTHHASDGHRRFAYSNASDALNLALTGHKAAHWVATLNLGKTLLRDQFSTVTLEEYKSIESLAAKRILNGIEPMQAVRDALEVSYFKVIDHPFN